MKTKIKTKGGVYLLSLISITVLACMLGFMPVQADMPEVAQITTTGDSNAPESVSDVESQIRQIAEEEEFQWPDYLIRLARCESRLDPNAIGDSGSSRGLFQIHSGYWPGISDEEAFDIEWSTKWTMDMINSGYQHYWSCDKLI